MEISALPALGFIVLLLPVQAYLGKQTSDLGRAQTAVTTERVHLMSELLTAIKLIKFYAWQVTPLTNREKPFSAKINELRQKEMSYIYRGMVVKAVNYMVVFAIPVLIALTSLGMYVGLGNKLTASMSFTILSVYNTLRYPFLMLPMAVKSIVGSLTAFSRLDDFFASEEVEETLVSKPAPGDEDLAFDIVNFRITLGQC